MNTSKLIRLVVAASLLLAGVVSAQIKVASLHPIISDVARNVGGKTVTVVQLIDSHADPHHFRPTPKDLAKARGATMYLASGKNLETYLTKLRSTLGKGIPVIEVGRKVPSEKISGRNSQYVCCPQHANGSIDPHWWHRVSNVQKAARIIASEFAKVDPANAKAYKANAAAYSRRLEALDAWVKREVSKIPRANRILTTAHAAFGYYCKEYGFKALPVKGLTANHKTSATYQAEAIQQIRKNNVKAVFPELRVNPKSMAVISRETGVKMGGTLVADGASNYEKMMRDNTTKIVAALAK